jgi:protein tyrosine phosphatase (PTP) superfamily phosphohydrolase (DUF442 family)
MAPVAADGYITPEQARQVSELLSETESDVIAFCKHFKVECIDFLRQSDLERAIYALQKKLGAK